ncbi:MAG TPA: GNAT family protein [Candidatus Limnocylindria bacterium]|jgi:RimJ/RimL family protein N-acetyltransferase
MYGPVLVGTKVTLRPPVDSDAELFVAWFGDLEVTRYLLRRFGVGLLQEEGFLQRLGESPTDVFWMLEADGQAIGATGIHQIDWLHAHGTTGIVIGVKSEWGKGRASEAMAIRTDYAFRQLNLHKLMSGAFVENEPSKRALLKAGYREVGIEREHFFREGRWHDHWLCEIRRSEWEQLRAR